jgi:Putative amidoligase enzyme
MSTVRELYGLNAVKTVDPSKVYKGREAFEPCQSTRSIGIEVEVENHAIKLNPSESVWHSEADGSLRNNGTEYISRPVPANFGAIALQELLGQCLDEKECCFSPRTSIHIHVNMQDVETEIVEDIILLYSVFEKLFFRFTGRGRIKNIYCVPLTDTECLNGMVNKEFNTARGGWSKYSALNILPIAEYGTIEFRHMHGTFDVKKISVWIRLLTTLCDYVIAKGGIRAELLKMSSTYDYAGLLQTIFGMDAEYLKYQHFNDVKQTLGRVKTAFTNASTTTILLKSRDLKSTYFVGI